MRIQSRWIFTWESTIISIICLNHQFFNKYTKIIISFLTYKTTCRFAIEIHPPLTFYSNIELWTSMSYMSVKELTRIFYYVWIAMVIGPSLSKFRAVHHVSSGRKDRTFLVFSKTLQWLLNFMTLII